MLDYKGKEKDFRVMMEEKMWSVYTHTLTHWNAHVHFFLVKGKKRNKRILRGKEKYTKKRKREGEGKRERKRKEKGGFSGAAQCW